jgi:hypothetical protein
LQKVQLVNRKTNKEKGAKKRRIERRKKSIRGEKRNKTKID